MKKSIIGLLTGVMIVSAAAAVPATIAKPSTHRIFVDDQSVCLAVYEIVDSNYFKLVIWLHL